ncbi:hypothetical protein NL676_012131 [Syzygium grande]|nr:hypothetical protein NL676_012131 [Syzygium grande]
MVKLGFFPDAPIDVESSPVFAAIKVPSRGACLKGLIMQVSGTLCKASEPGDPYTRLGASATIKSPAFPAPDNWVRVSEFINYPVRGLVFEGGNTIQDLSNAVSDSCICLEDANIPYNALVSNRGKGILLFPQCGASGHASKPSEVGNHWAYMVLKRKQDHDEASEEKLQ